MSARRSLPCGHCGEPIAMELRSFFPSRRYRILCPACGRGSVLPWTPVLVGLAVTLLAVFIALGSVKALDLPRPETIPAILGAGVLILLLAIAVSSLACRFTRFLVSRLDPLEDRWWNR